MSCRAACARPLSDLAEAGLLAEVYVELVRTGRQEDFRWLARSQGLAASRTDELWAQLTRRLGPPA
jgi:hypothetical protein